MHEARHSERRAVAAAGFGVTIRLALLGCGVLALGALVYVLDRPADTVHLLPSSASLATAHEARFGTLGNHLPAFAHACGFILLTAAVSPAFFRVPAICLFWWAVDSLFEIGQHQAVAAHVAGALPAWLKRIPVFDNTGSYFLRGTFDPVDLTAIALGALAAYFTIRAVRLERAGHGKDV